MDRYCQLGRSRPATHTSPIDHSNGFNIPVSLTFRNNSHLTTSGQVTHRAIHVFGKWPINGLLVT
jgi:hypothetical protein